MLSTPAGDDAHTRTVMHTGPTYSRNANTQTHNIAKLTSLDLHRAATAHSPFFTVSRLMGQMLKPPFVTPGQTLESLVDPVSDLPYLSLLNTILGKQFAETAESRSLQRM